MTTDAWLSHAIQSLTVAGISTARLDCLVLLEDVLNTNRTQILAHPERELTEAENHKLDTMLAKRTAHIPLAYIRGKSEFYGKEFIINAHVLEPRPESETIIDMLLKHPPVEQRPIIDIGTGSGALAIIAAIECPTNPIYATDIDPNCIEVAKANAKTHGVDITFLNGNLLSPLPSVVTSGSAILLCNLPYVPDNFQINTAATHEPRRAIFGGPDGLEYYRRLFTELGQLLPGATDVYCESLPPQHSKLVKIAEAAGFVQVVENDLIQLFRRSGSQN